MQAYENCIEYIKKIENLVSLWETRIKNEAVASFGETPYDIELVLYQEGQNLEEIISKIRDNCLFEIDNKKDSQGKTFYLGAKVIIQNNGQKGYVASRSEGYRNIKNKGNPLIRPELGGIASDDYNLSDVTIISK